jgi:hypothetical protein
MGNLTSLPSKVVRAFRFYLLAQGVADAAHVYHQFDSRIRDYAGQPIVDVMLKPVGPEVQFVGNDTFIVEVQVKFNAKTQAGQAPEDQRIAFDAVVGKVRTAMMQDDGSGTLRSVAAAISAAANAAATKPGDNGAGDAVATANADLADFTLLEFYQDVYGSAHSDQVNWAIVQRYRVVACESVIA